MAPEQLRGKGIGKATDIYAFAAIIYEMLSGNPPFYTGDLRWQIMHEEVEPIEGQPDHVNAALFAGLAKERDDRPQSAGELVGMLTGDKPVQQSKRKLQKKKKKPVARKQKGVRKEAGWSKYLFVGLGLLLLAALAVGGYYYSSDVKQLVRGGPILSVGSEPPGALLFVDDGRVENTPTAVSDLPNGTHAVRLELDKYLSHTEKIFIQQDKPIHLNAKLVPEPFGELYFESTPAGAEIFIENKPFGITPNTVQHINTGKRLIELKKEGFDVWQRKVEVKSLVTVEVIADLELAMGQVKFTSVPSGAKVSVDGKIVGITPLEIDHLRGQVDVVITLPMYKFWQKQVRVVAGETEFAHAVLWLGEFKDTITGMEFIGVKGGCYQMGDTFGRWQQR